MTTNRRRRAAPQLAERLIKQDGVKYMLGPYSSGLTKAIAPVTEKYKIPMVEAQRRLALAVHQGLQIPLRGRCRPRTSISASAIDLAAENAEASAARSPPTSRSRIAFENDPFSQDVRAGVVEDAKKYGMKIVIDDKLPPDLNDMSATLTKVKALKPDLLVVSGHAKGAALAIRQIAADEGQRADARHDPLRFGADHQEVRRQGRAYTLCASPVGADAELQGRPVRHGRRLRRRCSRQPTATSRPTRPPNPAAAVEVFANAFERRRLPRQGEGARRPRRDRHGDLLRPIKFDDTGKNIAKPMVLYQVQDGQYGRSRPSKWAAAKVVYPRPSM